MCYNVSVTSNPRIRWQCPSGQHPGELGPRRPRADALVRYCLPCSQQTGRLVPRVAPALERKREASAARSATKAKVKRQRTAADKLAAVQRETDRFTVAGVDLRDEARRYARLPAFGGPRGRLAQRPPRFTVRVHRGRTPNRLGTGWPDSWRIHMGLWPDMPLEGARHTLIHELTHLHVGHKDSGWHGPLFRATLAQALREAGVK